MGVLPEHSQPTHFAVASAHRPERGDVASPMEEEAAANTCYDALMLHALKDLNAPPSRPATDPTTDPQTTSNIACLESMYDSALRSIIAEHRYTLVARLQSFRNTRNNRLPEFRQTMFLSEDTLAEDSTTERDLVQMGLRHFTDADHVPLAYARPPPAATTPSAASAPSAAAVAQDPALSQSLQELRASYRVIVSSFPPEERSDVFRRGQQEEVDRECENLYRKHHRELQ